MRRFLKWALVFGVLALVIAVWVNYPKLNLITGFAAKNVCSCVFVADRDLESVEKTDNGFSPVKYASNRVDLDQQKATATILGLKPRTAIYSPETGCTLLPEGEKEGGSELFPKRLHIDNSQPYPFGDQEPGTGDFAGVDMDMLHEAVNQAFEGEISGEEASRAVLVLYKDQLVLERYAPGFSAETKFQGWSMTKSIMSGVYGILHKQGRIDLDEDHLFPEWDEDSRREITLNNLLQMNSGLAWEEDYSTISDVTNMLFLSEDMSRIQKEKKLVGIPGETWLYSSGVSNLLSGYMQTKFPSHQEYLDFWYEELIDKIGMHSMVLETDLSGNYAGSSYSWATARDWAKFGLLYLHRGQWQGEQILEESWIDYTTSPAPDSEEGYGAQFWINSGGLFPDVPRDMFSANGFQGQHVFIIPSKDLVVVRFGLTESPEFDVNRLLSGIISSIE